MGSWVPLPGWLLPRPKRGHVSHESRALSVVPIPFVPWVPQGSEEPLLVSPPQGNRSSRRDSRFIHQQRRPIYMFRPNLQSEQINKQSTYQDK